ncbi:hypothetical protein TPHA_0F00100 [Tetrapisispora phaffii CBS 4417]|uniref:Glycosyl transferase family 1 domain-containing protein n=1 Tax=Tetrapisispora phaffii (strain ATCC 24235 / CBS 4417 / NBRC 1672 / NRRL Y-8282 / UCD 70-5) TaxID=1071381 RepID=G8BUR5_TETPH|nr:hypothetical protein TPHA_0F00100 [Tetrapisispora phaffii CBS 4417]CCE63497.1 hypothetical protein TPHA_0F00100 [Tetrapisispora phaffii CBS 4417]
MLRRQKIIIFVCISIILVSLFTTKAVDINSIDATNTAFSITPNLFNFKTVHEEPELRYNEKRVTFVSRHPGTKKDFGFLVDFLELKNVTYYTKLIEPKGESPYILTNEEADEICETSDYIFVTDCLTDGWNFIRDRKSKCKNLHFIVSQRADFCAKKEDKNKFLKDLDFSLNREDEFRTNLIPNNIFEVPYAKFKGVNITAEYPVIRPFGYTDMEAKTIDNEEKNPPCLIAGRVKQDTDYLFKSVQEHTGYTCKKLPELYGGPKTLSQYNSIIVHLPHQVSVMKMWENIAHGVLIAIPSPSFLDVVCEGRLCNDIGDLNFSKKLDKKNWAKYCDFYNDPKFSNCFIQYESWEELKQLLESRSYLEHINECRDIMQDRRLESLRSWRKIFEKGSLTA